MEIPFNLIWVIRPLTRCLLSGGAIRPREVELVLEGPEPARFRVELGYCDESGCWYGLFDGLERMLDEQGWDSDQVEAFSIRGKTLSVGGWLGEDTGILPWEELIELLREMVAEPSGPPPDAAAIRALPELGETWEVGIRVARWISEQQSEPVLSYIAAVLDGELVLRQFSLKTGERPGAAELANLILEAALNPREPALPGRPRSVRFDDRAVAAALAARLADAGIPVDAARTLQIDALLDRMMDEMRHEEHPLYFTEYDDEAVRAFFRTAARFYRARPWERFDGTKYVGFRIGEFPWQYASIMGQAGEEPGLSIFDDWLQLCRFVYNQPDLAPDEHRADRLWPLRAAGALEGVTLSPLHFLHPDDADRLLRLGIRPFSTGDYPLPHRYVAAGLERPHLALPRYRLLMLAVVTLLETRPPGEIGTLRRTIDVGGTPIRLVYPANARDEFGPPVPAYRLVVEGAPSRLRDHPLPPGARVEIEAAGDTRIDDVAHALKRAGGLWADAVLDGEYRLWNYGIGRLATTPRLAHLAGIRDLRLSLLGTPHPASVTRQEGAPPAEIQVRMFA